MADAFFWYELMTSDIEGAKAFYTAVVGWDTMPFDGGEHPYIVLTTGARGIGGIMPVPPAAAEHGLTPRWIGYVHTTDIDAKVAELKAAGGMVMRGPETIPTVGRFAVAADPQGVMFNLLQPDGPPMPKLERGTIGKIDWNELHSTDWEAGYAFYAKLFGWSKTTAMDMGPMGIYQLFTMGSDGDDGGMMNVCGDPTPPARWMFYFSVDAADAAAERIVANGGKVVMGPHEVPGPSWIVTGEDPQGVAFAVVAPKR